MADHPLFPVDHEVPCVVVVSAAELGSKHKLVDASDRRGEHTRGIVVSGALVHQHVVEDDRVKQDFSQLSLVGNVKKNSAPWDTDSCLNQMLKDRIT